MVCLKNGSVSGANFLRISHEFTDEGDTGKQADDATPTAGIAVLRKNRVAEEIL